MWNNRHYDILYQKTVIIRRRIDGGGGGEMEKILCVFAALVIDCSNRGFGVGDTARIDILYRGYEFTGARGQCYFVIVRFVRNSTPNSKKTN